MGVIFRYEYVPYEFISVLKVHSLRLGYFNLFGVKLGTLSDYARKHPFDFKTAEVERYFVPLF